MHVNANMKNFLKDKKIHKTLRDGYRMSAFRTNIFTYKYQNNKKNFKHYFYNKTVIYFLIKISGPLQGG